MVLNDTLQKRQDCLEQCELERIACELEEDDEKTCEEDIASCKLNCDFDYGP